jgi:hypothetical protein
MMRLTQRVFASGAIAVAVWSPALQAQGLPDHSGFTAVLEERLHGDLVDYEGLGQHPEQLDSYLAELSAVAPGELAAGSREAQLALWINAYNACTLKLVIDHYPIKKAGFPSSLVQSLRGVPGNSIRQIPDTWSREFCDVAGEERSLDEIEHEILRPMGEPRIHFAVNCASRSCPVLAPAAYTAEALDEQLDAAVQRLVGSAAHYSLEKNDRATLRLNKVLDWYKDDFGGKEGVVAFLLPYLPAPDREYIAGHGPARVEYFDYDWTLNDTAVFGPDAER